jgi:hypothetical protein
VTARALRAAGQPDRCVVELEPTRGDSAGWVIGSGETKCEWKEGKTRVVLTGDQSLVLRPPGTR